MSESSQILFVIDGIAAMHWSVGLVWFGGCPAGTEPKGQRGTRKEDSGGATSREPCDASRLIGFLWMSLFFISSKNLQLIFGGD